MKIYYCEFNDYMYFSEDTKVLFLNDSGKWITSVMKPLSLESYSKESLKDGCDIVFLCEVTDE